MRAFVWLLLCLFVLLGGLAVWWLGHLWVPALVFDLSAPFVAMVAYTLGRIDGRREMEARVSRNIASLMGEGAQHD